MGASPIPAMLPRVSFDDYLMHEEVSPVRHEFHDGVVTMMAGGNRAHAEAAANWMFVLQSLARGGSCKALGSDLAVWIEKENTGLYPDVALYCGSAEFQDAGRRFAKNPRVIVEVLSPSTHDYDLSAKFSLYKELASLDQYICMEPEAVEIHVWTKQHDGEWVRERFSSLSDEIEIPALGKCVRVEQVYAGLL